MFGLLRLTVLQVEGIRVWAEETMMKMKTKKKKVVWDVGVMVS